MNHKQLGIIQEDLDKCFIRIIQKKSPLVNQQNHIQKEITAMANDTKNTMQ